MTCIIGYVDDDGSIYMGGDSAGVSGYHIVRRKDPKIYRKDKFLFGFTSSFRMGQLLAYSFKIPDHSYSDSVEKYMNTSFIEAVRTCFKDGGYSKIDSNRDSGGNFLVGYMGKLFEIDSDFQVGENIYRYASCGCGREYAFGAMHTLEKWHPHLSPVDKILSALDTTSEFCNGVCGPFYIEKLESPNERKR